MSKRFLKVSATLLTYLTLATTAFAQTQPTLSPPPGSINPNLDITSLPQIVINWFFALATFLALAYLMYGGIKYITSRGDKVAVDAARRHILSAVIGLVIVVGSFFALNVVFKVLGAKNPLENLDNLFLKPAGS